MAATGVGGDEQQVIWIARHGEREDIVDREWYKKTQRSYDDPPLADKGQSIYLSIIS